MGSLSGGRIGEVASRLQAISATNLGVVAGGHTSGSLKGKFDAIATEVDELVGIARTRSAEIDSEIGALREKVRGLSGTEDALDGTLLIKQDDQTIAALKHRNNYWREGLLGFEGADGEKIESHLRSRPVAAAAAAVLGHPIVLARVPSAEGVRSFDVIPTRVLSPPEGYLSRESAEKAAYNLLSENPGKTGLITYDGLSTPERWHVLAADFDSSPRTVAWEKKKMFGRTDTRTSVEEVMLEHTTDDVRTIVTTNNDAKASVTRAAWPEGRSTPLSAEELNQLGMTHAYKSEQAIAGEKITDLESEAKAIRDAISEIKPLRDGLIRQKRILGDLASISDRPGKLDPSDWEGSHIATLDDGTGVGMGFDEAAMATHISLPGTPPAEAALTGANMKSENLLAIMQDADGHSHIVFTDRPASGDDVAIEAWNDDVRAIVNPVFHKVLTRGNETISAGQKNFSKTERYLHNWVQENVLGQPEIKFHNDRYQYGRFGHWSDEEPGRVLAATDLDDAIGEAMQVIAIEKPDKPVYVVATPKHGPNPNRFILIKGDGSNFIMTENTHQTVKALITDGVAYPR